MTRNIFCVQGLLLQSPISLISVKSKQSCQFVSEYEMDSLPEGLDYNGEHKASSPRFPLFKLLLVVGSEIEMKNFTNPGLDHLGLEKPSPGHKICVCHKCCARGKTSQHLANTITSMSWWRHNVSLFCQHLMQLVIIKLIQCTVLTLCASVLSKYWACCASRKQSSVAGGSAKKARWSIGWLAERASKSRALCCLGTSKSKSCKSWGEHVKTTVESCYHGNNQEIKI